MTDMLSRRDVESMPDSDLRNTMLASLGNEAKAHTFGWDNVIPMFFQYYRPSGHTDVHFTPTFVTADQRSLDAVGVLEALVESLTAKSPHERARTREQGSAYLGCGIISEGWIFPGTQQERAMYPNLPLPDVPGSIETRFLCCVMADGSAYQVQRIRGTDPVVRRGRSDQATYETITRLLDQINQLLTPEDQRPVPERSA